MSTDVLGVVAMGIAGGLLLMGGAIEAAAFVDHGAVAPVSRSRGATAAEDAEGNRIVLIWLSDHRGCRSLLVVDAESGETEQIPVEVKMHDSPFHVLHSTGDRWYSLFGERFYEFDPATREFTFTADTPSRMGMGMREDASGMIWVALYPDSHLVRFDPATQELVDFGSLNTENWPQYPSRLAVDEAGWVYLGIGNTRAQIVAFDPETGATHRLIPDDERPEGAAGVVYPTGDGQVYATARDWGNYTVLAGELTPWEEATPVPAPARVGSQESVFRGFPDGSRLMELDVPERRMVIRDADGTEREVHFSYESDGSHVLSLQEGPDGAIYGSTGHPLRVYRFDPRTGELSDNGLLDHNGHWNAVTVQAGKLYAAMYGNGILFEYDVTRHWADRDENDPNPRELMRSHPDICRPHALTAHPDGRHVIMGGTPGYGFTGGGLLIYDTEQHTGEVIPHTELVPNQSTNCLIALPDGNLLGGTTIMPGTGGEQLATEAQLYIFDWEDRSIVWRETILPGRARIMDLVEGPDRLVHGFAVDSTYFVFDPAERAVVHQEALRESYGQLAGAQAPRVMIMGPDGFIYTVFTGAIVRIDPGSFAHEKLAEIPAHANAGVALIDGRIYFAASSRLWSYGLPQVVEE